MNKIAQHFIYFQDTEGGMDSFQVGGLQPEMELRTLPGWMDEDCKEQDQDLLDWMETAEVGTYCEHRLGCLVRMRDTL